jgi:RNA polymerase sigma-70 factor (ECF subfamily)
MTQTAGETVSRWVEEHGGKIYGLGLRLCGSPAEAEDLVQETFLQAFRNWDQFAGRSSPSSWLFTIASRLCQRRHRRRSGEPARMAPLEKLLPSGERDIPDVPDPGEGPLDESLRREAQEAVEAALPRIPLTFRLPLVLKDIAELSVPEIAQALGVREATVKTRIHRARLALRRELAKQLPRRAAPPPGHDRQVCLDLLRAKQESLDRGVPLQLAPGDLCARCRSLFSTLDLTQEACHAIGRGELPDAVRDVLRRRLAAASPDPRPEP